MTTRAFMLLIAALAAWGTSVGAGNAADLGGGSLKDSFVESVPATRTWYFKGYLGMSNQYTDDIYSDAYLLNDFTVIDTGFDSAPLFGIGIGLEARSWLRFDLTGEYRGKSAFHGLDSYPAGPGFTAGTNDYDATKSEWVGLANAYIDLGTWRGFTPYFGGGIGWSLITIDDFKDVNTPQNSVGYAEEHSVNNFAWALYAGLSYDVTPSFTVDLAYRYINLGDAKSGTIVAYDGSGTAPPLEFHDVASHDLLLGVRWKLDHANHDFESLK